MTNGLTPVGGAPGAPQTALSALLEAAGRVPGQSPETRLEQLASPASLALPGTPASDAVAAQQSPPPSESYAAAQRASLMSSVVQANLMSALRNDSAPVVADFASGAAPFLSLYNQYGTSLQGSLGLALTTHPNPEPVTEPPASAPEFDPFAALSASDGVEFHTDNPG